MSPELNRVYHMRVCSAGKRRCLRWPCPPTPSDQTRTRSLRTLCSSGVLAISLTRLHTPLALPILSYWLGFLAWSPCVSRQAGRSITLAAISPSCMLCAMQPPICPALLACLSHGQLQSSGSFSVCLSRPWLSAVLFIYQLTLSFSLSPPLAVAVAILSFDLIAY